MATQPETSEPELKTLEDLDDTLAELIALRVVQVWPSRENRFRAEKEESV